MDIGFLFTLTIGISMAIGWVIGFFMGDEHRYNKSYEQARKEEQRIHEIDERISLALRRRKQDEECL